MKLKNKIRILSFLVITISLFQTTLAQIPENIKPFTTPFGEFAFARPQFPPSKVNIVDFGASEGGTVKNTEAINRAIRQLSESGGGTVIIPSGKWLTGPVVLLSNINLHLEDGAELLFSQDFNDYLPAVLTNWEGSEVFSYSPFIYSFRQENIAITGKGVLNGQGKPWWEQRNNREAFGNKKLAEMNENEVPVEERRFDNLDNYLPPVFFGPLYCKNILLEGVTFKYGAFWTINPSFCENLIIRELYVLTNGEYGHAPNGDGINPNSCQNVLIEYNTLDTGDDCITIKSGRNKDGRRIGIPCKNILIRHNTGLQGHGGIVIGSEMSGGVENLYAHDCRFNGTDRVIRIKTDRGRGGYVRNCWFRDISADTIQAEAIRINMLYSGGDRLPSRDITDETPVIENLWYENINCLYSKKNVIQIKGIPEMPVKNVTMKNINIGGALGIDINDAENIELRNLTISNEKGPFTKISYSEGISITKIKIVSTDVNETAFIINSSRNITLNEVETSIQDTLVNISADSENIETDGSIPGHRLRRAKTSREDG
jgi:polygalacturonase